MKKKLSLQFLLMFIAGVSFTSLQSCKIEGCTDPDSVNYDADADTDDGSCEYEGSVVFWYTEAASTGLIENDAQSLTIYVADELIGSYASSVFFTESPNCEVSSVVSVTKNFGGDKQKTYPYKVIDNNNVTWWEGTVTLEANTCMQFELQWSNKKNKTL